MKEVVSELLFNLNICNCTDDKKLPKNSQICFQEASEISANLWPNYEW